MWQQRVSSRYLKGHLPCLMPYNDKKNVLSALLNKTFPSFLHYIKKNSVLISVYSLHAVVYIE